MRVSDLEFEEALSNEHYIGIMELASKNFRMSMSREELKSCKYIALWTSLKKYDETRYTAKFTTYLFLNVKYECMKYVNLESRHKQRFKIVENIEVAAEEENNLELLIELIPEEFRSVVKQKFLDNKTLHEIGKAHGYSHETARKNIQRGLSYIKKFYD
jgi:RNA polymerase sigma factor (sigma-70 family)